MSWIEDELHVALQRREPPEGFSERVLAQTTRASKRPPVRWHFLAIAAALIVALSVGLIEHKRQEAMVAKKQLLFAMELASGKLQYARNKIMAPAGAARKL